MKKTLTHLFLFIGILQLHASYLLIPMDYETQKNHLKAYGITYWVLSKGQKAKWLLNYRGGSFLLENDPETRKECLIRGVTFEEISSEKTRQILQKISSPNKNQEAIILEKAPKIAVYSPPGKLPWDDAVTLVLTFAEIPYDIIYDKEVLEDKLVLYDWLHLHHEDFSGQHGKFYASYRTAPWYVENKKNLEQSAKELGFDKVSKLKLAVAQKISDYIIGGGFMFAMCSATDSFDIALAAANTDICEPMFDGDPSANNYQNQLDYSKTFAFKDFRLERNPMVYEFSNIDTTRERSVPKEADYFTLMQYSAKWDPIPTMLTQNHTMLVKGFMGQTTAFNPKLIKSPLLILGTTKINGEAKYIHGIKGKGMFTFYGGHDPEDYKHRVGEPPTELSLHPTSPGYRLILNNVLFPAAKKKKQKT